MSRTLQLVLSLLVSAGALWFCLRGVNHSEVFASLLQAHWIWILATAALAALSLWVRALRWGILLGTLGPLGDTPVFAATCIGFMGNMVLPLRAGEAIRPLVVARRGRINLPAALATIAIDRMLDMVMLGVFAAITLALVPADPALKSAANGLLVVVAIGTVALCLTAWRADWLEARVSRLADRLPATLGRLIREGTQGFVRGVKGLSDAQTLVLVMLYSAGIWALAALGFATGALALDISAPLLPLGLATTVIVAAAVSVPSAPGFIGVFQAGSKMALALFGVSDSTALAFGLLTWVVQMVVIVSLGIWALSRLNLSLGEMTTPSGSAEAAR